MDHDADRMSALNRATRHWRRSQCLVPSPPRPV